MGFFSKLKNVIFEEEEIEVPVEEPKKEKPIVENSRVERKRNVYEEENHDESIMNDRNLFKAEKTFDFPVFDDREFEEMKQATSSEPKEEDTPKKTMGINLFDYEKPKAKKEKGKAEEIKGRAYNTKSSDLDNRKFRPSPVISPVYGILDKNYKKEDIVVKKEEKRSFDVDDVRKKAFGTLEDDIERTLMETKNSSKMEEKREYDLVEETSFDTIDVTKEEKKKEPSKNKYFDEDDVVIQNDPELEEKLNLEVLDEKGKTKTKEEKIENDDTLENDLFDLIDSMYENREDE